ncbi:MAG: ferrous iron transport protein A [Lachnospiraceae bacterium]|nr:ferrous iron transport protein A [Lachnospiraceae bacterium]
MPLCFMDPGEEISVKRVGGSPEVKKHLENMVFVPGHMVSVVSKNGGNLIVKVKESRVALNEQMAGKIMV